MKFTTYFCILAFMLTSCNKNILQIRIPIWTINTEKEQGKEIEKFFSFPTPRTSHPPGYVFRTSKISKGDIWVTTLKDSNLFEETSEFLPESSFEVNSEYLIKFLGLKYGNLEKNKKSTLKVKLYFENCIREAASEDKLTKIILKSNINFKPNEKYYIVQAVIKSKKISITFDSYDLMEVKIKAQIDSLSSIGKLNKSVIEKVIVSKEFDVAHRVLYKSARINSLGLLSNSSQKVILSYDDEGIITDH